jgi:hypothetical protein
MFLPNDCADFSSSAPAPTSDLQIGEVRLQKLVWSRRLFPELIRRLD